MLRLPNCMRLGAMLWAGGAALLALHLVSDAPSARLLASTEMRDLARGAGPIKCTHHLVNTTCGDYGGNNDQAGIPCRYKPQNVCARRCKSCTNLNAPHSYYTNKWKPWNVHQCAPGGVSDGCGVVIAGAKCQWNAAAKVCICVGGNPIPDMPCFQGKPDCKVDCLVVP